MNEEQLLAATAAFSELAIEAVMLYLTLVTGYLIVAHIAGANLNSRQLYLINSLFAIFGLFCIWGSVGYFSYASYFWTQTPTYEIFRDEQWLSPNSVIGTIELLGIMASLNYMREIRSAKKKDTAHETEHRDK
ncbi:MAG: hypothetical protein ACU84Q_17040 [Gammaproteobacteria bacterium]